MSFTENEFANFNKEYRYKKVVYALQNVIDHKKDLNYAQMLIHWLNQYENCNYHLEANQIKDVFTELKSELFKINPYLEEHLFDHQHKRDVFPITLLLDNIRTPFNVGSIMRSAEAMGVEKVILTGICPTPENNSNVAKSQKNANIDYEYHIDIIPIIKKYQELGYQIYCLEKTNHSHPLKDIYLKFPALLVLGNEEFGITGNILKLADKTIHIPLYGNKNSINVSVATGIALNHIAYYYSNINKP